MRAFHINQLHQYFKNVAYFKAGAQKHFLIFLDYNEIQPLLCMTQALGFPLRQHVVKWHGVIITSPSYPVMATQGTGGEGLVCSRPGISPRLQPGTGGATGLLGFQPTTGTPERTILT